MLTEACYPQRKQVSSRQFYGEDGMRLNLTPPIVEELRTELGIVYERTKQLARVAIPVASAIFLGSAYEASAGPPLQGPKGPSSPNLFTCENGLIAAGVVTVVFLFSRRAGKKHEPKKQDGGIALKIDPFTGKQSVILSDRDGAGIAFHHDHRTGQDSIEIIGPKKPNKPKK